MSAKKIIDLERKIGELTAELTALRRANPGRPVPDYTFQTQDGEATLRDLFGDRDQLLVIHNMGEGCRYCTLWADGFNGLLPHLESAVAVVLVSKDHPRCSGGSPTRAAGGSDSPPMAAGTTSASKAYSREEATTRGPCCTTAMATPFSAGTRACSAPATCTARCGDCLAWRGWTQLTGHPSTATGGVPHNSTTAARTCSTEPAGPGGRPAVRRHRPAPAAGRRVASTGHEGEAATVSSHRSTTAVHPTVRPGTDMLG